MARWLWWSAPALPVLAGCLLADVSVDEDCPVAGAGGSTNTAVGALHGDPPMCMRTSPDPNTYWPDKERACGDYCTLYTCICANHPANEYADTFDCLDNCIDSDWPIGSLSTI